MTAVPSGFTSTREAQILDDPDVGLGNTTNLPSSGRAGMHLHLFYTDSYDLAADPKSVMNDDATVGTVANGATTERDLHVLTATGGGPQAISSSDFANASAGNPSTKALTGSFTWIAGANFGHLCWWAITGDNIVATEGNPTSDADWNANFAPHVICHGPLTDGSGNPTFVDVANGESYTLDAVSPILVQLGDEVDSFG